jgi:hypothetical protein
MDDEIRECVLWGLQQRQAGLFTAVATMSGKQHVYLLWVEDAYDVETSVLLLNDTQQFLRVALCDVCVSSASNLPPSNAHVPTVVQAQLQSQKSS